MNKFEIKCLYCEGINVTFKEVLDEYFDGRDDIKVVEVYAICQDCKEQERVN